MTKKRVPRPAIRGRERDDLRREVVRLYRDEGLTLRQAAQRTGHDFTLMHRLLVEAGVPRRPKTRRSGKAPGARS